MGREADVTTVAISGGFDPVHVGHLDLIENAADYGQVIIILNSDAWLKRKKGFAFMSWDDRARILGAIEGVHSVIAVDDADGTVCEALKHLRPGYFANGGDRTMENTPELKLCLDLGIKPLWNIGGGKKNSSSKMVREAAQVLDW